MYHHVVGLFPACSAARLFYTLRSVTWVSESWTFWPWTGSAAKPARVPHLVTPNRPPFIRPLGKSGLLRSWSYKKRKFLSNGPCKLRFTICYCLKPWRFFLYYLSIVSLRKTNLSQSGVLGFAFFPSPDELKNTVCPPSWTVSWLMVMKPLWHWFGDATSHQLPHSHTYILEPETWFGVCAGKVAFDGVSKTWTLFR